MVDISRMPRRRFVRQASMGMALLTFSGPAILGCGNRSEGSDEEAEEAALDKAPKPYTGELKISLAQWSHHKEFQSGDLDPIDFAQIARGYGIDGIEYVNSFYKGKAKDTAYLDELNKRASDNGVTQLLIMIDGEGELANTDTSKRIEAIENHYKWVEAARYLGCHSIRVNSYGVGSSDEVQDAAVDGLGRLGDFAKDFDINVIVENHGGYSSHGGWLAGVMRQVNMPNVGTLPDFGNFCLKRNEEDPWGKPCLEEYDRYLGVEQLMPFAKAVSAKSYAFNDAGEETTIDYKRMIDIVKAADYSGFVGIEYEGEIPAPDGIMATKRLLERCI